MLLIVDNYDSFTYNLVQLCGELGAKIAVFRNRDLDLDQVALLSPTHIMISPGPGTPDEAGISMEVIRRFAGQVPMLGVCLGHQCLAQVFGGQVVRAGRLVHGKTSLVHHQGSGVFRGLSTPFAATRYHSLLVESETLPPCLAVTAATQEGEIMGLRHRELPFLEGVQFHPEAILTEYGRELLVNFLRYALPREAGRLCRK
ncbi:MAG: Aminodeoxychorismate/anthranilate synthase component 2 [Firmicutes bacterium]|nr:Aminodeoxychorismate/anthranilate synthase component 2 [Bacillota bacterium]